MAKFVVRKLSDHYKTYHTDALVGKTSIANYNRPLRVNKSVEEQFPTTVVMLSRLFKIPGVVEVWVKPYEVSVKMAEAFAWNQKIDEVVKSAFDSIEFAAGFGKRDHKVVWDYNFNVKFRTYHADFTLANVAIEIFYRPLRRGTDFRKLDWRAQLFVEALFKIPGITEVLIKPYDVSIEIGQAFDWIGDGIHQSVLDALVEIYG